MRNKVAKCTRDFFSENGFIEVETPVLTRSTPEGAGDYLVPSRVNQGKILCITSIASTFKTTAYDFRTGQILSDCKCFHDERFETNRQRGYADRSGNEVSWM